MVSAIFTELANIVEAFVTLLVNLFSSVVDIFWTPASTGDGGTLTIVGILMLVGLATGLVIWAFKFIRSLIRVRTK